MTILILFKKENMKRKIFKANKSWLDRNIFSVFHNFVILPRRFLVAAACLRYVPFFAALFSFVCECKSTTPFLFLPIFSPSKLSPIISHSVSECEKTDQTNPICQPTNIEKKIQSSWCSRKSYQNDPNDSFNNNPR